MQMVIEAFTINCIYYVHKTNATGKSDPYCFITIVKSEHVDMISSARPNVVKINDTKELGMKIEKSHVIPKTLNPEWNQEFEL